MLNRYREEFERAASHETLDIMVRARARRLGVEYQGSDQYATHAEAYRGGNQEVYQMFIAAETRLKRIEEDFNALHGPSYFFG